MMYKKLILFGLAILLLSPAELSSQSKVWREKSSPREMVRLPSLAPIVNELDSAVVFISSTASLTPRRRGQRPSPFPEDLFERFFGQPFPDRQMPRRSGGSGFIINEDGFILTNNHVIEGAEKIEVKLASKARSSENEVFEARVIGTDPRTDVAVIKIDAGRKLSYAPLGNSDEISKGDWVLAFGNPFGLEHSVSLGIVSAKEREINANENRRFDEFIQTDAAINFGNSGGPLVNLKGEVIGINTAITAQGSGIGFAIPINLAKRLLPQLTERGRVSRGYLGVMIRDVDKEIQEALGLRNAQGVFVNEVAPDGPAASSALRAGDIIVRIDGQATPDARSLQRVVGAKAPGEAVNIELLREGNRIRTSVTLGSLDQDEVDIEPAAIGRHPTDRLGLAVKEENNQVVIEDLSPDSQAFRSGALPGDVIKRISFKGQAHQISSLQQYNELLEKIEDGDSVMLNMERRQGNSVTQIFVSFRAAKSDS